MYYAKENRTMIRFVICIVLLFILSGCSNNKMNVSIQQEFNDISNNSRNSMWEYRCKFEADHLEDKTVIEMTLPDMDLIQEMITAKSQMAVISQNIIEKSNTEERIEMEYSIAIDLSKISRSEVDDILRTQLIIVKLEDSEGIISEVKVDLQVVN